MPPSDKKQEHAVADEHAKQILYAEVLAAGLNPEDFAATSHSTHVRINPPDEGEEWRR